MDPSILQVICPLCGEKNDTPCIYDGSYELICSDCDYSYYIIIKNGAVHIFSSRVDFNIYRESLFK